jgi:hypothetical protein
VSEKTTSPPPTADDFAKMKGELEHAKKETAEAQKALEALRRKRENKKPTTEPPSASTQEKQTSNPQPVDEHGHTEGTPHYIGSWQQYCPTCGDRNPDFKDETKCDGCGVHLGAREVAEKLKACPNCGGHSASVIKT